MDKSLYRNACPISSTKSLETNRTTHPPRAAIVAWCSDFDPHLEQSLAAATQLQSDGYEPHLIALVDPACGLGPLNSLIKTCFPHHLAIPLFWRKDSSSGITQLPTEARWTLEFCQRCLVLPPLSREATLMSEIRTSLPSAASILVFHGAGDTFVVPTPQQVVQ